MDVANPCTQGSQTGATNANKSGIVFFPGSAGLYRNGTLVGGLGVSGDGVDEDDYVTNGGTFGFEAPTSIRADQDRKSTRLNSSHGYISYAGFCLKKKRK